MSDAMIPDAPARPKFLLVMTATIKPSANAQVGRSSPELRLDDYKRALRFWLSYPHPAAEQILFLENSGADLSELRTIAENENPRRREVEFLFLPPREIPAGTNYGYAEMQMLDEGMVLSRLRPATTHMIKVTGRLTFSALGRALDRVTHPRIVPLELMIDCHKLGLFRRGYDARVQLFACSHDFYDRVLRGSNREMNATDTRLLEHLIYRKVIPFKGQPGYYLRFPSNIEPQGYFGFKNRRYDSPRTAISRTVRAVLRVIAPGYWF